MSLDSASYPALWSIYTATNQDLLPEYVLPVLWGESNFVPSAENADHYGLNQVMGDTLRGMGIQPSDYQQWPASQQLTRIVKPSFVGLIRQYGAMRSGTRLYQSNFLPVSLKYAFNFDDVICRKTNDPHGLAWAYAGNPALDPQRKGYITVGDVANRVATTVATPQVATAIAQAYLPSSKPVLSSPGTSYPSTPSNPVYGTDYTPDGKWEPNLYRQQTSGFNTFLLALAGAGIGGALLYGYHHKRSIKKLYRRL